MYTRRKIITEFSHGKQGWVKKQKTVIIHHNNIIAIFLVVHLARSSSHSVQLEVFIIIHVVLVITFSIKQGSTRINNKRSLETNKQLQS